MTGIKARKKSNTFVWIILAVLVVSLTGFGVRQIGTSGAQAVGTVGDEKITVNSYQRALSARLRSLSQTHQNFLRVLESTASGGKSPFRVGCHCAASSDPRGRAFLSASWRFFATRTFLKILLNQLLHPHLHFLRN